MPNKCSPTNGTVANHREVGPNLIVESRYTANARIHEHQHEHAYVGFILNGAVTEFSTGGSHNCGPGSVVVRPSGMRHHDRIGPDGARVMVVSIRNPGLERVFDDTRLFETGPVTGIAARIRRELSTSDSASDMMLNGLLLELAGIVKRDGMLARSACKTPPSWLVRARERLLDECLSPPSLTELAEDAGVHPDHLSRTFKQVYKMLPGELVRSRRLDWSVQKLLEDDSPLSVIAIEAGFADQSHFSRAFKQRFGVPPGRFRRRKAL